MQRQISSYCLMAAFSIAGCAASEQPAARAPSVPQANAVCCCGYGAGFRGGYAATTRTTVAVVPTTRPLGVGFGRGFGRGMGPGAGGGLGFGNRAGMRRGMPEEMAPIHALLDQHHKVQRTVKEIPGGVETLTTSEDAAVTDLIRQHARQMKEQLESGRPIRMWDPLFVELFRHHDKVSMAISDVPGGVKVTNTSDDPQVTLLIRQHATRGVSEFAAGGFTRAHQPTPLPEGYVPSR